MVDDGLEEAFTVALEEEDLDLRPSGFRLVDIGGQELLKGLELLLAVVVLTLL